MNKNQMYERLVQFFPQSEVEVHDLTGGEDHWEVAVISSAFKGLTRIEQHQKVMEAFAPELKTGEVHALAIKTKIKEN